MFTDHAAKLKLRVCTMAVNWRQCVGPVSVPLYHKRAYRAAAAVGIHLKIAKLFKARFIRNIDLVAKQW
jgi:hypothetical protein